MSDHVMFKHEDSIDGVAVGPVWVVRNGQALEQGDHQWYTLRQARKLAGDLSMPLREV